MLIFIQEPSRGKFDKVLPASTIAEENKEEEQPIFVQIADAGQELLGNPTGLWILAGASVRAMGTNCLGFYKPLYF